MRVFSNGSIPVFLESGRRLQPTRAGAQVQFFDVEYTSPITAFFIDERTLEAPLGFAVDGYLVEAPLGFFVEGEPALLFFSVIDAEG